MFNSRFLTNNRLAASVYMNFLTFNFNCRLGWYYEKTSCLFLSAFSLALIFYGEGAGSNI
jgi:hypothetical protein